MRTGITILGSLGIAVAAFVAGLAASEHTGFGRNDGVVRLKNSTSSQLRVAEVSVDSCGQHTGVYIRDVPVNGEVELRFIICGEGAQMVRAVLSNGKRLITPEIYVKSGARTKAEVTDNAILCEACALTPRWSGRVKDKVPSPDTGARAAQLNR